MLEVGEILLFSVILGLIIGLIGSLKYMYISQRKTEKKLNELSKRLIGE